MRTQKIMRNKCKGRRVQCYVNDIACPGTGPVSITRVIGYDTDSIDRQMAILRPLLLDEGLELVAIIASRPVNLRFKIRVEELIRLHCYEEEEISGGFTNEN